MPRESQRGCSLAWPLSRAVVAQTTRKDLRCRSGHRFQLTQQTVAPADLQTAVATAGANGHVVTAISNDAAGITFFSYGWQADTNTPYEAQVATVGVVYLLATSNPNEQSFAYLGER